MSVRRLLIKFNNRNEPTTQFIEQTDNMRTRSGLQYSIHSHELPDEERRTPTPVPTPIPTPMPVPTPMPTPMSTPMPTPMPTPTPSRSASRMLQPFRSETIQEFIDLTVEPMIRIQPINKWKRRSILIMKMCGGYLLSIIRSLPTILASVGGVVSIMHFINPPEQEIEVSVTTKYW